MGKQRLEAFSDGVLAIIITIMVLELKVPHGADLDALCALAPSLLGYLLSFVFVGIYWNNHHHLLHASTGVDGKIMWANLHLLFWLSLVPLFTAWVGENWRDAVPTAIYGVLLFLCGLAFSILLRMIVRREGPTSRVARATAGDVKGNLSLVFYALGAGLAFVNHWLAVGCYVAVAVMWFVPDPRLAKHLDPEPAGGET